MTDIDLSIGTVTCLLTDIRDSVRLRETDLDAMESALACHDRSLDHQAARLDELHIGRAYLSSTLVRARPADLAIYCKAWPVRNGDRFPKTAFALDWEQRTIRCPNGALFPFEPGGTVRFPTARCAACPLRARCITSTHGRSVTIHRDERLLVELRQRHVTPTVRAKLREWVAVEHALAHIGHWQGRRARYRRARDTPPPECDIVKAITPWE